MMGRGWWVRSGVCEAFEQAGRPIPPCVWRLVRESDRVSVVQWGLFVKDQVGRLLTAIGGGGGGENWMVLCAVRHYITGGRSLRLGRWGRRPGGLSGLLGRGQGPGLALLLELLHVRDGGAEGTLQLRALLGDVGQHDELFFAEFDERVDRPLTLGDAREQPLGGDHGFQVAPFGAGLRLPFGFHLVPELVVVRGVFAGKDGAAAPQAVSEGVEADGFLAFRGFRTGGMLGILAVSFLLLSRVYY